MIRTTSLAVLLLLLFWTIPAARADKLSEARDLVERGMYHGASQLLEALTAEDEDDHEAWALLGRCCLQLGELDKAYNAVAIALDLVEDANAGYWKLLGDVSFAKGEAAYVAQAASSDIKGHYADAQVKYEKALELDPGDSELLARLGYAFEWQEYPEQAKEAYERQIEKFPKTAAGYLRMGAMIAGEALRMGGGQTPEAAARRAEAVRIFEQGLEKAGPDAEIYYNLGIAHEWDRERAKARECYFQAIRTDPECNKAWKRLYEAHKVPAEELMALGRELLKKHPRSPTVATWLGFFLIGENQPEAALDILMNSLKHHREAGNVYQQAFRAAMALLFPDRQSPVERKPEVAIAALVRIHEYYPWYGSAANNVGLYYRDSRPPNYRKSLEWYVKAAEREPWSQDILNDTGLIYLFHTTGSEREKALPYFDAVLSLVFDEGQKPERGFWDALENLCKYYWEVERNPELVLKYSKLRREEVDGVKPYAESGTAAHYGKLAEQELKKDR